MKTFDFKFFKINDFVLIIRGDLGKSYSMKFDGSERAAASITAPSSGYTYVSASALVNGQLFIFGGETGDYKKVLFFSFSKMTKFRLPVWPTARSSNSPPNSTSGDDGATRR